MAKKKKAAKPAAKKSDKVAKKAKAKPTAKKAAPKKAKVAKKAAAKPAKKVAAKKAAPKKVAKPAKAAKVAKAPKAPKVAKAAEKPVKAAKTPKAPKAGKEPKAAKASPTEVATPTPKPEKKGRAKRPSNADLAKDSSTSVEYDDAGFEADVVVDADGNQLCKVRDCDQMATVESFCRYHYILFWKNIQLRKKILDGDKLSRYINAICERYPDKFIEMIRKDFRTEKDFHAAIQEIGIDDPMQDAVDDDNFTTTDDSSNFADDEF